MCGDTVLLAEGDRVPTDLALTHTANLALDESLLTGESAPVQKQAGEQTGGGPPAQAFSGTLVTQGSGQGRVVATGERSALGRIGQSLQGIASETTPIQRETQRVDKTGTLTANRMAVRRLWSGDATYDSLQDGAAPLAEALHSVLEYAVLASRRRAYDPMETAIVGAGAQLLARTEHLHADWTLVEDYPLSPAMLAMSRVWQSPYQQAYLIAAKGAPEAIVDLCHLPGNQREHIAQQVAAMAADGLRVLGVASARFAAPPLPGNQHDFDFVFLGLVGLEDPLRPDVPAAIAACQAAGIRVVMMTGDHPATALGPSTSCAWCRPSAPAATWWP